LSDARAKTSSLTFSLYSFFTFHLLSLSHIERETKLHCFSFSLQKSFTPQKNSAPFWQGMYTLFTFLYTFTIFTSSTLLSFFYYFLLFFFTERFLHAQLCKDLEFLVCVFGVTSDSVWYAKYAFIFYIFFIFSVFSKYFWENLMKLEDHLSKCSYLFTHCLISECWKFQPLKCYILILLLFVITIMLHFTCIFCSYVFLVLVIIFVFFMYYLQVERSDLVAWEKAFGFLQHLSLGTLCEIRDLGLSLVFTVFKLLSLLISSNNFLSLSCFSLFVYFFSCIFIC